jgi:hypothetical protein
MSRLVVALSLIVFSAAVFLALFPFRAEGVRIDDAWPFSLLIDRAGVTPCVRTTTR